MKKTKIILRSNRISLTRPLFWGQPWDMDIKMVIQVGDAFFDIYTFNVYENEVGELFLAAWLFCMGYSIFFWVFYQAQLLMEKN